MGDIVGAICQIACCLCDPRGCDLDCGRGDCGSADCGGCDCDCDCGYCDCEFGCRHVCGCDGCGDCCGQVFARCGCGQVYERCDCSLLTPRGCFEFCLHYQLYGDSATGERGIIGNAWYACENLLCACICRDHSTTGSGGGSAPTCAAAVWRRMIGAFRAEPMVPSPPTPAAAAARRRRGLKVPACTFPNGAAAGACEMCGAPRPCASLAPGAPAPVAATAREARLPRLAAARARLQPGRRGARRALREERVAKAYLFLSDPDAKDIPLDKKIQFLEGQDISRNELAPRSRAARGRGHQCAFSCPPESVADARGHGARRRGYEDGHRRRRGAAREAA